MGFLFYPCIFIAFLATRSSAQTNLYPGQVPLAVRSPYLTSWLANSAATGPSKTWPAGTGGTILGWAGFVRIDGHTYSWLGNDGTTSTLATTLQSTSVTPTQTIFTLTAENIMEMNVTFLSPIEPGNPVNQSIPFSYLAFEVRSLDGHSHDVSVYTDISGEWNSIDTGSNIQINWTSSVNRPTSAYHSIALTRPTEFQEQSIGMAMWGTVHYAAQVNPSLTYKTAGDNVSRPSFTTNGVLDNALDDTFRPINGAKNNLSWPVFAFAQNLGEITSTGSSPILFAIGHTFDADDFAAAQFNNGSGQNQKRSLYYTSQYQDVGTLIDAFFDDFPAALARAQQLDRKILGAAQAAVPGQDFDDLVSLATRQVLGATQLTISRGTDGAWNTSDAMMFMRDMGTPAGSIRTNPVEILYGAFPMLMFVDPSLGGYLLEPLLRAQASYDISYAASDLGSSYPSASTTRDGVLGQADTGIEQTGNMLIMAYAHLRASNDNSLVSRYYPLLTSWADYLGNNTLDPQNAKSADGLSQNGQTNLAIKGIIAVQAMSGVSAALNQPAAAGKYANLAKSLYGQWESAALDKDDGWIQIAYNSSDGFSLGYNLFADRWLNTGLVNTSVFSAQAKLVRQLVTTSNDKYGFPIDSSNPGNAYASWNMFVAAMLGNGQAQTDIVSALHNLVTADATVILPHEYVADNGTVITRAGSAALGAVYAPMLVSQSLSLSGDSRTPGSGASSHVGAIVGGVIGGLAGLALLSAGTFFFWRRRYRRRATAHGALGVSPFRDHETAVDELRRETDAPSEPPQASYLPTDSVTVMAPFAALTSKQLSDLRRIDNFGDNPDGRPLRAVGGPAVSSSTDPGQDESEAARLRDDVENLRRVISLIRAERLDAPPVYDP
ncbi:hypothetical protein OF83DRAFT_1174412 [Amylostereum chailletii]|nr:hypothetical protein OF83DRAFT_1174412 [Amylostereum chailletii]